MERIERIIREKRTNVVLSVDLRETGKILSLVEKLGHKLLGVKLHSDIIVDYSGEFILELKVLSNKMNFLIIEDRKFCDIGNTVKLQSEIITEYADLITVHSISGPGVIAGLRDNCLKNRCGILLIAQMSSSENLMNSVYTEETVKMAENNRDIVVGFIAQQKLAEDLLTFTPGVSLSDNKDGLKQNYNTPKFLVEQNCVDILIVGRGLYENKDPLTEVNKYIFLKTPKTDLIRKIKENDIFQIGEFILKSGYKSDFYVDFRKLMSYPELYKQVATLMTNLIDKDLKNSVTVCGVPTGGIPLATMISSVSNIPQILLRDKVKDYGMQNLVEGNLFNKRCVLVEDVVTTGSSVLKAAKMLEDIDIKIEQIVVVFDRQNGGIDTITNRGYIVKSLFSLSEFK